MGCELSITSRAISIWNLIKRNPSSLKSHKYCTRISKEIKVSLIQYLFTCCHTSKCTYRDSSLPCLLCFILHQSRVILARQLSSCFSYPVAIMDCSKDVRLSNPGGCIFVQWFILMKGREELWHRIFIMSSIWIWSSLVLCSETNITWRCLLERFWEFTLYRNSFPLVPLVVGRIHVHFHCGALTFLLLHSFTSAFFSPVPFLPGFPASQVSQMVHVLQTCN